MEKITLIGAGLTGPLMATYLANHGYCVDIYEQRPDMRKESISAGRSINLAMSERGNHALKEVGLYETINPLTIPMRGRMIHDLDGSTHLQPYGQRPNEVIHSVPRAQLNKALMTLAEETGKVKIHFNKECTDLDLDKKTVTIKNSYTGETCIISYELVMGVDGSASAVREAIVQKGAFSYQKKPLGHGYKELTMYPKRNGDFRLYSNALHIWPRGQFMLIALPNKDKTFTCTLFFPIEGPISFETVNDESEILKFFQLQFPDTIKLIPDLVEQFQQNPVGQLASVYCDPWHYQDKAVLLGDAAHAVVPFFGQGMNASFQDCSVLSSLIEKNRGNWSDIFSEFSRTHVQNGHAIADMAVENYLEMRDHVNDPEYKKRRKLELKFEEYFPEKFIPRYSMVSFHRLPYAEVYQRGEKQFRLLDKIIKNLKSIEEIDKTTALTYIKDL